MSLAFTLCKLLLFKLFVFWIELLLCISFVIGSYELLIVVKLFLRRLRTFMSVLVLMLLEFILSGRDGENFYANLIAFDLTFVMFFLMKLSVFFLMVALSLRIASESP